MPPTTSNTTAIFAASRKILYPFLQVACYGLLGLSLFAQLFFAAANRHGGDLTGFTLSFYAWLLNAWNGGLLSLAVIAGFSGLLFLRFWEKLGVLALMLALAWLAK